MNHTVGFGWPQFSGTRLPKSQNPCPVTMMSWLQIRRIHSIPGTLQRYSGKDCLGNVKPRKHSATIRPHFLIPVSTLVYTTQNFQSQMMDEERSECGVMR